jgi:hypothetical protein
VGRVAYFVKATPVDQQAEQALHALGLPVEPQRFAIVQGYSASPAQDALSALSLKEPWVRAAADALKHANLLKDSASFTAMINRVRNWATVLRVTSKGSNVRLSRTRGSSGELDRLAIPLSSNFEEWYHKGNEHANWTVTPVVRIDPRRATVHMTPSGPAMQAAMNRIRGTVQYFVRTYSSSNSRL